MKKILVILAVAGIFIQPLSAQRKIDSLAKYRRASLYSVLITHLGEDAKAKSEDAKYHHIIRDVFGVMPLPEKFNDHSLQFKYIASSETKARKAANSDAKDRSNFEDINNFILSNAIAKNLVAKWFNRDSETGICNMNLISERGNYDAQQADIQLAKQTMRGLAAVSDAGKDLIGHTFLLVNDITFVDKGERSAKAAGILAGLGALLGGNMGSAFKNVAAITNTIDGLRVNITSYLYQLDWEDSDLYTFWEKYWTDESDSLSVRNAKRDAFDNLKATDSIFYMKYLGRTTASAGNTSVKTGRPKKDQMLVVCARAIDKSIVKLQREYEDFKVNVPIYRIDQKKKTVDVQIGLKEGINSKSEFDVLMPREDESGHITYERIGHIKAISNKIWDNRFGALDEARSGGTKTEKGEAKGNVNLDATTFKILSGAGKIIPGCLVREVTIKK